MIHSKFARRPICRMTEEDTSGGGGFVSPPAASPATEGGEGAPSTVQAGAEWDALPKSWTRDLEQEYKAAPEKVRQFIHRREQDVEKGISTYREGAERWNRIAPLWQQHPDADAVGVTENLVRNHFALLNAPPEHKAQMLQRMASFYGVELTPAQARQAVKDGEAEAGGGNAQPFSAQQLEYLKQVLGPAFGTIQTLNAEHQARREAEAKKQVDAFFSDPKNEFVGEVATGMHKILQSGVTRDLAKAYELAILENPDVKARYFARLAQSAAGQQTTQPRAPNGTFEVKSSAAPAAPGKPRTIDETLAATAAKFYAKA